MQQTKPTADKLLPAYPLAQVARFVGSNPSTLHSWFHGRTYKTGAARRKTKPMVPKTFAQSGELMSFLDLVEAHVLILIRKGYRFRGKKFHAAMDYLRELGSDLRFLAYKDLSHDKSELYLTINTKLISLSESGQYVAKPIIADGLKQLMYGEDGYADSFYPLIGGRTQTAVMLNPVIGFGQPILARLGVNTAAIAARFDALEPMASLAADYGATEQEIEYAIRCSRQFTSHR